MIWLAFLISLLLTVVLEGLAMLLLFRRMDYVYFSLLGNLLTNPTLNLLLLAAVHLAGPAAYWPSLAILEIAAILVECHILRLLCGFSAPKALGVSLLLNILSCSAGLIVSEFLPISL